MLDLFFRKYAWTASLVLLFAAAWLSAKTFNTVVGFAIRPKPAVDLAALPSATVRAPTQTAVDADRLYPLIGQQPPAAAEEGAVGGAAPTAPRNCDDVRAAPVRASLRAQLVAGIIAERPQWSMASITDGNSRETRIYGVGDSIQGARVLAVTRIRDERDATGTAFRVAVILCNGGTKEYLDFEGGEGSSVSGASNVGVFNPVVAPASGEGPSGPSLEGIKKVADNRYEIRRNVIENTLSNLNTIATQARIVPSFKNGVANGFKVFSIQPGSLYSSIGVENGDVIQRINGYEINSPDKALEIYQKLRDSQHITMDIERNGQIIRKEYNVSGP